MSFDLTGSSPTSDDASVLSVIQPTAAAAAAAAREQQCTSGLFSNTDWSSAATGDPLNHVKPA